MRITNCFKLKRITLMIAIFLSCQQTVFAYDLNQAVFLTLHNHPEILSAKAGQSATLEDVRQAMGGWYPRVDVSAGYGREYTNNPATRAVDGGSVKLTRKESEILLSQLLYDGGFVSGNIKQRRYQSDSATHHVAEVQERLAFAAVLTYHNILRNRELLEVRKLDVSAHRDILNKVSRRTTAGAGRKSEISLAESRVALAQSRLERAVGELDNSHDVFIQVVGESAPSNMSLPKALRNVPDSLKLSQDMAMINNPSIQVLASRVEANIAEIGIAQSEYYPNFNIELSSAYNGELDGVPGLNKESLAMLRMDWNVFRGGSDLAAVNAAKDRERSTVEELLAVKREVNENVAVAWNNLQTAKDRLVSLRGHQDKSLEVFNAYVQEFKLGQRTLFDLLNAQAEYYDARTNYINGQYEVRVGKYRLLTSIGLLVSRMSQGRLTTEQAVSRTINHNTPVAGLSTQNTFQGSKTLSKKIPLQRESKVKGKPILATTTQVTESTKTPAIDHAAQQSTPKKIISKAKRKENLKSKRAKNTQPSAQLMAKVEPKVSVPISGTR